MRWVKIALLAAALFSAFAVGTLWRTAGDHEPVGRVAAQPRQAALRGELTAAERTTIALFQAASPAVVYIRTLTVRRDFFDMRAYEIPQGTGSGFVWDRDGHVVTNYHVIRGASRAQVILADQSSWDAELVGAAPDKDLAVLRIEAPGDRLLPLPLGSSDDLLVGQNVLAIGNPFGLDQTLTTGVISALEREIESPSRRPIRGVIQTDAAINPGNSGGPLLDSAGRLIGVNTSIFSTSGAYAGIGFAVPVDTVAWVAPLLIANGRLVRPTLGIEAVTDRAARQLGVNGVLVLRVTPGGGAEQAGLRPTTRDRRGRIRLGDVITAIEGETVRSFDDLLLLLERRRPGDRVRLEIVRDDEQLEVVVVLGSGE